MSIDEMPAGRKMDALVAERVMGFRREVDDTSDYNGVRHGNEVLIPPGETLDSLRDMLPRKGEIPFGYFVTARYSTDIAAAWQVVERITQPPLTAEEAERAANTRFGFWWDEANLWAYSAPEAALLICRAALKAAGVS